MVDKFEEEFCVVQRGGGLVWKVWDESWMILTEEEWHSNNKFEVVQQFEI